MLVIHDAARLVEHFPAALPGQVAEVGVFQIEGREQLVEAAQLEKLAAIERAGSAAAVEARIEIVDGRDRRDGARAGRRSPTSLASGRFLRAACSGSLKKIWQETAKTFSSVKAVEQRREEIRLHAHVAVEQHDDVVLRGAKAGVRSAAEAEIAIERQHADVRESARAANSALPSVGAVVDDDDLVVGIAAKRFDDGRQILCEQIAAVPVGNHDAGGAVGAALVRRERRLRCEERANKIRERDGQRSRSAIRIGERSSSGRDLMSRQRMSAGSVSQRLLDPGRARTSGPASSSATRGSDRVARRVPRVPLPARCAQGCALRPWLPRFRAARTHSASSRHLASSSLTARFGVERPFAFWLGSPLQFAALWLRSRALVAVDCSFCSCNNALPARLQIRRSSRSAQRLRSSSSSFLLAEQFEQRIALGLRASASHCLCRSSVPEAGRAARVRAADWRPWERRRTIVAPAAGRGAQRDQEMRVVSVAAAAIDADLGRPEGLEPDETRTTPRDSEAASARSGTRGSARRRIPPASNSCS